MASKNTSYNRFCRVKQKFQDAFRNCVQFKQTHDHWIARKNEIRASADYQKLTRSQVGYMNGMNDAFYSRIMDHFAGIEALTEFRYRIGEDWHNLDWLKNERKTNPDIDVQIIDMCRLQDELKRDGKPYNPVSGYFWRDSAKEFFLS